MKLTDIVVLEAAPLSDDPVEIKDVVENFPSQYRKAIKAFQNNGRLRFGGDQVWTADGEYGQAINDAIKVATRLLKNEPIDVEVDFNVGGTELSTSGDPSFTFDADVEEVREVWMGYDVKSDQLLIGFDVWIGDNEFNDEWDEKFEQAFEEDFDMDNEEHEKVFNRAWKEFSNNQMFYGAIVSVNTGMHADMETPEMPGGFYRGPFKVLKKDNIVELT